MTAEKEGFKKQLVENIEVSAEATKGVDIALEAGNVSASVTVNESSTAELETENANVGKGITTQEVRELPQFGRDPYNLLRLTPGVFGEGARGSSGNSQNLPNQTGPGGTAGNRLIFQQENVPQISANGQRVQSNNYQIDGTSVNSLTHGGGAVITPNQESVKEVRVIANVYSAEYGRNSGAQVLTVSQNGTNQFHGSLFLKNNSPGLNAANKYGGPGPNGTSLPGVANLQHYNQYGGSIGGPIPVPRFGESMPPAFSLARNRAFFFFSFEGLRNNSSNTFNQFLETPEFRQQVLALRAGSVTAGILGASGSAPRLVSVIPVTCASAGYPANDPNSPCQTVAGGLDVGSPALGGQYFPISLVAASDGIPDIQFASIAAPTTTRGKQYNLRFDFNLSQKDTFAFSSYISSFSGLSSDTSGGTGSGGGGARPMSDLFTKPTNSFGTLTWTHTLSPTMINEARINFTRLKDNQLEASTTNFGIPRIEIQSLRIPGRIFFGAPQGATSPGIFFENTYEFRDTLRKSTGSHALSFGVEIRKEQNNNNLIGGSRPDYVFDGIWNFVNSAPIFEAVNVDPKTGGFSDAQRYFRTNAYAVFAQDDWKFRPNLTLNLGLRWDYFSPLREKRGRLDNFILGPPGNELAGGSLVPWISSYKAN